jgi:hypothetical protein
LYPDSALELSVHAHEITVVDNAVPTNDDGATGAVFMLTAAQVDDKIWLAL